MKVLHVVNYLSDSGGAEKLLEDFLPALKSKEVDVSVAVLRDLETNNSKNLKENGIDIIKVGNGRCLYSPFKMFKLIPIMRQFDVVHTHLTQAFLMGAFNSHFCKALFVNTVHNTNTKFRHMFFFRVLEKWALKQYDVVICCSKEVEKVLRAFWKNAGDNVITINNGINLEKFFNATPSINLINDYFKIVMVASFRAQKDHECLIRAAKYLPVNFHIYFVGHGPLYDGMCALSRDLGVDDRVHFLGKRVDVPQILKASDIVVLSSHYEGLPLSAIEGMATGKPLIASDVPGLRELTKGYGLLFEESNSRQLADAILSLSSSEELYSAVASRCLERSQLFGIERMTDAYLRVYCGVQ